MVDHRDILDRPAEGPDIVLRWADHDDGLADVWLPVRRVGETRPRPAPLVYAVHGGFWEQGYDRRHLRPLAGALCALGWAVVVPEYARVGGPRAAGAADGDTGLWPVLAEDLRTVRRRVPGLLAEVAPGRVTTDRPVLLGHSAGGQLVLWWAMDAVAEGDPTSVPSRVVALAPVADLARARAEGLGEGAVDALIGPASGEDRPPRAAATGADPAARLRAGELPREVELVALHGEDDVQVPAGHTAALGRDVPALVVRLLPATDHFALIDPTSGAWPAVRAALTR